MEMPLLIKSKPNHSEILLEHLVRYGSITPLEAWQKYGIYRLGARIWDLKQKGYLTTMTLENSEGKSFARYSLIKTDEKGQTSFL